MTSRVARRYHTKSLHASDRQRENLLLALSASLNLAACMVHSDTLVTKSWRALLSLGVLAFALASPASVLARDLRIVTIESAPFGFFEANGQPSGMMWEIGNLIAAEAGFTATNQIIPYARTVLVVENGEADFVLRYGSAELSAAAIQVAPVLSLPTIIVGKPSSPFKSLKDLRGKTVGTPRGGALTMILMPIRPLSNSR